MSQEKVLIVEDEENERTGLAEVLSAWGYRVETAADGVEGWDKVTQWSPAIIVTDLKMPSIASSGRFIGKVISDVLVIGICTKKVLPKSG